jgi:uncharacterized phage protein (TIGR01671 family)
MREIRFRVWDKKTETMWSPSMNLTLVGGKATTIDGNFILMQYTGLKDKNGVEVYEGDIVALDMWQGNEHGYIPEDGVIKWHQESSAFKWFSGDPSDGNNYWLSQADEKQREVIGNIYENPELLANTQGNNAVKPPIKDKE